VRIKEGREKGKKGKEKKRSDGRQKTDGNVAHRSFQKSAPMW